MHLLLFQVCESLSKSRPRTHLSALLSHLSRHMAPAASWLYSLEHRWIWPTSPQLSCTDPSNSYKYCSCDFRCCMWNSVFVAQTLDCLIQKITSHERVTFLGNHFSIARYVSLTVLNTANSHYLWKSEVCWSCILAVSLAPSTSFGPGSPHTKKNAEHILSNSQKQRWKCTHQVALVGGCFHWDKGRGWEESLK